MTDQTAGNMPWMQSNIREEMNTIPPTREPRQKRKPRKPAAAEPKRETRRTRDKALESAAAAAPKKPRKPKAERAAPDTIKVTMKEYAEMRVGDDAKTFIKVHGILSDLSKGSRAKVLAELSKVLG